MPSRRPVLHGRTLLLALAWLATATSQASAALPVGFQSTTIAYGLSQPVGLAFAPDGRLFIAQKTGALRVVKDGELLATPFLDVGQLLHAPEAFDSDFERGLLGVTVDPGFPGAPFVYVYYSVCKVPGAGSCQVAKNRVARVAAGYQGDPDRGDPASHAVLLDDIDSDTGIHNAGWLGFGPLDAKLYVSVGDDGTGGAKAQDPGSLNGKILRIDAGGGVPGDNPFVGIPGARPEIWALGLRNPWRCRFHSDGRLFCGDVGQEAWEEIDHIVRGGDYGWPETEGDFDPAAYPGYVRPVHAYPHVGSGSISVGDFGSRTNFPGDYQQSFFFGDYAQQWIRRVVLAADGVTALSVTDFEDASGGITDLVTGPDGALYCTDIFDGTIRRIAATGTNQPPVARASAIPSAGPAPLTVEFSSAGSTDADGDPLAVLWTFGDGSPTSTAVAPVHTYVAPGYYTATLRVSDGRAPTPGTDTVTVPITVGTPPVVAISQPVADSPFQGGQTIALAGSATDAEDGALPASALHWEIRFHHGDHWHPYRDDLPGSPQAFDTATDGETAADVSYRIILRSTDSSGLTGETSLHILPRTVTLRLETSPPGLQVTLDGQPRVTPVEVTGVVGVQRSIGAPSPQGALAFAAWSDGGAPLHTVSTPSSDTTYTAFFDGPTATTSVATTTTSTSTTGTSPTTSTSTSTVSTPTSTSTTTGSTPTTTSGSPASTSTSSTTAPPVPGATTTLPPQCGQALGPAAIGCRIDAVAGEIARVSSRLGRLGRALERRLRYAVARVERASALCEAGRLPRARAALRAALRRVQASLAKIRSRAGRQAIPADLAADLEQRVGAVAADLKALRDGLTCP